MSNRIPGYHKNDDVLHVSYHVLSIDMLDSYINGRTDMMANHIYTNSDH